MQVSVVDVLDYITDLAMSHDINLEGCKTDIWFCQDLYIFRFSCMLDRNQRGIPCKRETLIP
jgi:hypothetical protein